MRCVRSIRFCLAVAALLGWSVAPARAQTWQSAFSFGVGGVYDLQFDAAGNLYMAGYFARTATFGTIQLTSRPLAVDAFVAKRSPAGVWLWATSAAGRGPDYARGLTVDPATGAVYVTGAFSSDTLTLGAIKLANFTGAAGASFIAEDDFVARIDPTTGQWLWAVSGGTFANEAGPPGRPVLDGAGDIYTSFQVADRPATFGPFTLPARGGSDLVVACLSPAGVWRWANRLGGADNESGGGLVGAPGGGVYVCGAFASPTMAVGATTLTNAGTGAASTDAFVASLTAAGAWSWAVRAGGSALDGFNALATDSVGALYAAGYFSTTAGVGATTLTAVGGSDALVAKLSPAGQWGWAVRGGGLGNEPLRHVLVARGRILVTGQFVGQSSTWGVTTLTGYGAEDVVVAALSPQAVWCWAAGAGSDGPSAGHDYGYALARNPLDGLLYAGGTFFGATFTAGPHTLPLTIVGGYDSFMAVLRGGTCAPLQAAADPADARAGLALAPNPAHDAVHLTGLPADTRSVEVLDALGRVVRTVALAPAGAPTVLDVRGLPAGLYGVRAGRATRRLVVE